MNTYRFLYYLCLLSILWMTPQTIQAQDITENDYNRAVSFLWENLNNKKVFNTHVRPHWFEDDSGFWYLSHTPTSKKFMKVQFSRKQPVDLFDHEQVATELSTLLDKEVNAMALPFNAIERIKKGKADITIKGQHFTIDLKNGEVAKREKRQEVNNPYESISPNVKLVAYT